ncbi:DNA-binding FadR family transcriptional regulator [Sinorhizobium kostiense]|uniref:DNA-binding FadR family transcriptional regulator n=1 Tax=Sinorhizobium kostiense TaxID=76747 RepID=A0ABS4R630_9HYPH|nr:DNA-binding FadR family transcriptional regulator [Sinorhizobium kostiense]
MEFEKWDAVFHRIIVEAARNGLLASLYEGIHAVRAGNLWGKMKGQSIKDRDPREAEQNMHDHIAEARTAILGPNS